MPHRAHGLDKSSSTTAHPNIVITKEQKHVLSQHIWGNTGIENLHATSNTESHPVYVSPIAWGLFTYMLSHSN
jgi:hypothetical protein